MSDDELLIKLRRWLFDAQSSGNADGRPVQISKIDAEADVPEGTTSRLFDQMLAEDTSWIVLERKGEFVRLAYEPGTARGPCCK